MTFDNSGIGFDTTGQVPPRGVGKHRLCATLWEEEGTLVFHVVLDTVVVARREDNHMINASKLLDASGLSQERKNEILGREMPKNCVVEAPAEYLVGTWIPFSTALDLANEEGITERLYPLFLHNIGALVYQPKQISASPVLRPADKSKEEKSKL